MSAGVVTLDWPTETAAGRERHLRLELRVDLGAPAVLSGPPECWAPAEGLVVEVRAAWLLRGTRARQLNAARIEQHLAGYDWENLVEIAVEAARQQAQDAAADAAEERAARARGLL